MLLGAILLVVAFLVLAATVARLDLLPAETAAEQGDPFPYEVRAVRGAINETAERMKSLGNFGTAGFNGTLDSLEAMEEQRGYILRVNGWCQGSPARAWAEVWMASASSEVHLKFNTGRPC